jgi:hypothetical protein
MIHSEPKFSPIEMFGGWLAAISVGILAIVFVPFILLSELWKYLRK